MPPRKVPGTFPIDSMSNEFDPVLHFVRLIDLPDQLQSPNDLADGARVLLTVSETGVSDPRGG